HRPLVSAGLALLVTAVAALTLSTVLIGREQLATRAQQQRAERQRDRADHNFALARQAVEHTVNQIAENQMLKEADFHELRKELLQAVLPFYVELVQQSGAEPELEVDRGKAYYHLAVVHQELGARLAALEAYDQGGAILARLAQEHPDEPTYRYLLA